MSFLPGTPDSLAESYMNCSAHTNVSGCAFPCAGCGRGKVHDNPQPGLGLVFSKSSRGFLDGEERECPFVRS